ncbi:MAG: glucosylceramidase, partial [Chloroflexi bacterium]|nr:glucosylceramidase [Chloroflexota bacterium]
SDEVWTGIEYEVAALLLYEGAIDPALRIVAATRARYDGRKQNPWNDIECGDHYVRAMASWTLLEAASGFSYDAGAADLTFAPAITPDDYRAPFVARDGWGTFAQRVSERAQTETIALRCGTLTVKSLRFRLLAQNGETLTAAVSVDGSPLAITTAFHNGDVAVTLAEPLTLAAGQMLTVQLAAPKRRERVAR